MRLKLHRRLLLAGVPIQLASSVCDSILTMAHDATEDELATFVQAAHESE